MYYENPNPSIVRYPMHAQMLFLLPTIAFLVHVVVTKIAFLSDLNCFQHYLMLVSYTQFP
jgi:hypothetical protein